MKRIALLTIALAFGIALTASGQSMPEVDDLYNKYSTEDGVFSMNLNHEMLDAVDMDFDWDDQMKHITGDIYHIKFITFTDSKIASRKIRELDDRLKQLALKEIKFPADKTDTDVRFARLLGDKHGNIYKNVVMLLITEDNIGFFVAINGNLKVNNQ